jgi:hypothetical protein
LAHDGVFLGYGLQEQGIKPVKGQGAKRKADQDGEDYLFHAWTSCARLKASLQLSCWLWNCPSMYKLKWPLR